MPPDESIDDEVYGSPLRSKLAGSGLFQAESLDETKDTLQRRQMRHVSHIMATASLDARTKEKGLKALYIVAFLHFESPVSVASLRQVLQERLFELPRFRSRAVVEKGGYWFQELPLSQIDMAQMVQEVHDVQTPEDLDEWASGVYERPFDLSLPLWRAYIMNDMADGRSLFCWVSDHCLADGSALVAALMSILDDADAPPAIRKPTPSTQKVGVCRAACLCMRACFNATIGDHLPGDRMNRLKERDHRRPDTRKALSQSPALSLEQIKEVKAKIPGATINDVLMTVVCLALQSYFDANEPEALKHQVRANFPINLRRNGQDVMHEEHFGNRMAIGFLSFPLHIRDPVEMLQSLKKQIDVVKVSPEPYFRDFVVQLLAKSPLPRSTCCDLVLDLYGKVTVMLSNVPGPQTPVSLAGQPLADMSFYALTPLGLYMGLVSYNGKISCGVAVSKSCEPDARTISDLWVPSFEKLYKAAMAL